jgi:small-conductance mechanosensitive channel
MERLVAFSNQLLLYVGADPAREVFGNQLHQYLLAVFVFLLSTAFFYVAQKSVLSLLGRVADRTRTDLDDVFVRMVGSFKPPFYLFLSVWLTMQYLEVNGIADTLLTAVLVLWVVYQAVHIVGILVEDVVFRHFAKDQDETTKSALRLLANLSRAVVWVIGILLILSNFGINVTSLVAGAGIAGIAIAFALQGILGDLFSSFSLYETVNYSVSGTIELSIINLTYAKNQPHKTNPITERNVPHGKHEKHALCHVKSLHGGVCTSQHTDTLWTRT